MGRVADLMERWCHALELGDSECVRWRATAWLHDALRDAPAERLRPLIAPEFSGLPDSYLHGPVTATRLAAEGCTDTEMLDAIRYHTLGNDRLGRLGRALIAADYLEPGRADRAEWRAALRVRLPFSFDAVIREVAGDKIRKTVERKETVRPELVSFWNECLTHVTAR
jgi:2-amino-4-hydroxy-6-hydroxymethyldihydropteridine diphosphokinase